jgi:pimeloyl-ACP methyl ester carboxylesterase
MAIANVNGVDIYYETQGSGEPVLLVPPSWWPCATWNVVVVPMLARRYRTIIYDGRGTGRSGKPKDDYTVRQFAADGVELLKQLGVTRCHAVGFAIGGQIVQAMAIERPDLIASLAIAATGPGSRRLDGTPREVAPDATEEIKKIGFEKYIRSHIDNDRMAYNHDYYRSHREVAASLAQALWSGQSTVDLYYIHEQARLSWDTLADAPKVKSPTLVLCGAEDGVERRGSTPCGNREDAGAVDSGSGVSADSKDQTYDVLGWRRRADRVTRFLGAPSDPHTLNLAGNSSRRHTT